MAYAVTPAAEPEVLAYLDDREGGGYLRRRLPLTLLDDHAGRITAWCYVPNPEHPSYFGEQDPQKLVRLVATGRGKSGTALDYLRRLMAHLEDLGAAEPEMARVLRLAERYREARGMP